MLVLFTIFVCTISYLTSVDTFLLYISYVLGFAILKGILSYELKDVFNIKKTKDIYKEVGLSSSIVSCTSLLLITIYYVLNNYKNFSFEYVAPIVLIYILIYRFLFWDIEHKIKDSILKKDP